MAASSVRRSSRRLAGSGDVVGPAKGGGGGVGRRGGVEGALAPVDPAKDATSLQESLMENLGYRRRGEDLDRLSAGQKKALHLVLDTYDIPEDFEVNKRAYGPLSGASWEERVLFNASTKALPLKPHKEHITVCLTCGDEGHSERTCPHGLE